MVLLILKINDGKLTLTSSENKRRATSRGGSERRDGDPHTPWIKSLPWSPTWDVREDVYECVLINQLYCVSAKNKLNTKKC